MVVANQAWEKQPKLISWIVWGHNTKKAQPDVTIILSM